MHLEMGLSEVYEIPGVLTPSMDQSFEESIVERVIKMWDSVKRGRSLGAACGGYISYCGSFVLLSGCQRWINFPLPCCFVLCRQLTIDRNL